jgi:hypothetical protein
MKEKQCDLKSGQWQKEICKWREQISWSVHMNDNILDEKSNLQTPTQITREKFKSTSKKDV